MSSQNYPVAIIGAGPVGLAAAAHLIRRGEHPLVLEAGETVGASMLRWGHVRLFSPWRSVLDEQAQALLLEHGWEAPAPDAYPTACQIVEQYLIPLARLPQMQAALQLQTRVLAVSRARMDKVKTPGRETTPFVLRIQHPDGEEEDILARAVIDASGTYLTPNPLGAHGLEALRERQLSQHIFYGLPDVLEAERMRYAGKRVLVVGSGHSAQNTVLDLARLAEQVPGTVVLWAIRRPEAQQMFGGGEADALPERGRLGARSQALVAQGQVRLFTGVQIHALAQTTEGIVIAGEEERIGPVDEIIAATGFRPDLPHARIAPGIRCLAGESAGAGSADRSQCA